MTTLLLMFVSMQAQEVNRLYIPDLSVEAGKNFQLPVYIQNTNTQITGIQFDIELPNGLSVEFSKAKTTERALSHKVRYQSRGKQKWTVLVYSTNNSSITGNDGVVLYIPAIVSKNVEDKDSLQMQMSRAVLSNSSGTNVLTDYSCGNIKILKAPDFVVSDVESDATTISSESTFTVTWKISNTGNAPSTGGWTERVFLVSEDGESTLLGTSAYSGTLGIGEEILRSMVVKLGRTIGVDGKGHFVVELIPDENAGESESGQGNNSSGSKEGSLTIIKNLYVTLPSYIKEPKNDSIIAINIVRSGSCKADLNIAISNSKDNRIILPENITIPANSNETTLNLTIKSDKIINDNASVTIQFKSEEYGTIKKTLVILDDDGPNLHVAELECSDPIAGSSFTITWKVKNDGEESTGDTSWKEYVWLLPSISGGTSLTGSKLLGSVDNISALASGESYKNTITVTLPERNFYGNYDLVVTADMYSLFDIDLSRNNGEVPYPYEPETADYGYLLAKTNTSYKKLKECNEVSGMSDNFFYKKIEVAVPPMADLITSNVVAVVDNSDSSPSPISAAGLASSNVFYSGKKVNVTATLRNQGSKDVKNVYVSNALYICTTNDLSTGTSVLLGKSNLVLTLLQDGVTEINLTGRIPYEWFGDTYFIVQVDEYDAVYELANKENNICASKLTNTLLTPGADFESYALSVPSQISSGVSFDVRYSVKNIGPGVPYVNQWIDKIYISKKDTGVDETAKLLDSSIRDGHYSFTSEGKYKYVGDEYTATRTVNIKKLPQGTYYIYVEVDAEDNVFEYDGEKNNTLMSQAITLNVPDLTAELVSVSDETLYTGYTAAFTWKLKNEGSADIRNAEVKDEIYASDIKIGTVTNIVSIASGSEKTLRANIPIPVNTRLYGQRNITVLTNVDNTVPETNFQNNRSNSLTRTFERIEDIKVIGKNISVSNVQTVAETTPASMIDVSYTIKNTGTETIDKDVKHEVWLSKKNEFDVNHSTLCSIKGTPASIIGLKSTESVTSSLNVTIPNVIGGDYYLFIVVNRDKQLNEKLLWENTVKVPIYLSGNLPDLSISSITFPEEVNTMEKTSLSFTVTNSGDWDSDKSSCRIYLSQNDKVDNNSQQLDEIGIDKIKKGQSVTINTDIQVEDGIVGSRYLVLELHYNSLETTTENNISSKAFVANQTPLPDLVVSALSAEGRLKSGQPVTLNVKVTNVGEHATKKDSWSDYFYLMKTNEFGEDIHTKLGSKTHMGILGMGESYTATLEVILPDNMSGDLRLCAKTDYTDVIIESNEANDTISKPIYILNAYDTPAELTITNVSVPNHIKAGDQLSLSYTVHNEGAFEAEGILRDIIYLSKDEKLDENDEMVGVVSGTVLIQPGEQLVRNVTGRITNITEGDYHFIIRTNSAHTIIETNYDDNVMVKNAATTVSFEQLSLGSTVSLNTSGYFKIDIPDNYKGKTIGLYLSHPETSMAGLYAAYEKVPTTAIFDRHSNVIETTEQEVLIPNVQSGIYYVLAQDNASMKNSQNVFSLIEEQIPADIPMTITSREVPFGASTLSIKDGGNGGWVTTEIHGALLDSIMDFRLASNSNRIPAESITFKDQTATITTFNLNDAATGFYDVISELPDGTQATLPNGFRVIPGISVKLGVKLDAPSVVLNGSYAPVSIAFANGGNTDIAIKELLLVIEGGYLSTTIEGLNEELTELHFTPDMEQNKRGFVSIPPAKQEVFNCFMKQTTSGNSHLVIYVVQ